jgi:hypothetical protein
VGEFVANKETGVLADPTLREVLLSSFTALAGTTMVLAYRRSVIAGPLVALAIVPAAMVGVALATGRPMLAYQGAECFVPYVALIVAWGALVVALKQAFVHRRKPMVQSPGAFARARRWLRAWSRRSLRGAALLRTEAPADYEGTPGCSAGEVTGMCSAGHG